MMDRAASPSPTNPSLNLPVNPDVNQILNTLKLLHISRCADEKMGKLAKQNKGGTFQLSAAGHELIGVTCAHALIVGKDWGLPYYRDQGFALGMGCDLIELFAVFMGRDVKNHSSGRMMPHHYSDKERRIVCQSSAVGSQLLHAAGRGLAIKNRHQDEVVYVSCGDGATSQGDFHEALNFSALHQLPVIFVVQNNGWAISVPLGEQTSGGTLIDVIKGYKGLEVEEIDGTDYPAIVGAMNRAVTRGRTQLGPTLIMAHVPRLAPHSNSDNPKKYLSEAQEEVAWACDPIPRFEKWLLAEKLATPHEIAHMRQQAQLAVEEAAFKADQLPFPATGSSRFHVFASYDPPIPFMGAPPTEGEKIVMMDALNHALVEEMELDPHVVVFGQDVAHGKGGVFGITKNLTSTFGRDRCFNTPLAESTIIGIAIGLAVDGIHKPVAEIQFADYVWTGINQLFNEAASIHYRSNGEWEVPLVIRMPYGGYIQGGPYHSQSIEGFLAHCPGLKVVIPSNAADAKGLLKTAIRDPNPVVFLEHKALYRQQKFCARPEPSKDYLVPFGEANIVRPGTDLTVVCWGMMVVMAAELADKLAFEGISLEVIDLRTLVPLDSTTILTSVQKTGKLLIAHEAQKNCGFGAEIAAQMSEEAFGFLDAPIRRLCGFDSVVPYSKCLENEVLPQIGDLELAIRHLIKY